MKKTFFFFLMLIAITGVFSVFQTVQAQTATPTGGCNAGTCTYVPLEPLPGVNSSGLGFADYISGMFRLSITLGALFAVLMLVIAGIGYMIADSGVDIDKAKKRAEAALYGLLLLTACWLILYTINPNLLRFDLFTKTLDTTAQKSTSPGAQNSNTGSGTGSGSTATRPVITLTSGNLGSTLTLSGSTPENIAAVQAFTNRCQNQGGSVADSDAGAAGTTFTCVAP